MFKVKIRYRHDRKLYSINFLLVHFSRTWSCLFFPTAYAGFSFQLFMLRISVLLCCFKLLRLAYQFAPARQKGSHSFFSRGLWSAISRCASPSVYYAMCIRHNTKILRKILYIWKYAANLKILGDVDRYSFRIFGYFKITPGMINPLFATYLSQC